MRMRGASGRELIPNYYFWANLPTHMKVEINDFFYLSGFFRSIELGTIDGYLMENTKRAFNPESSLLFQNGVSYCMNGCRTADTYEQI